ncbi:MAG: acetylxylan esterase [Oscillospiraceae bacterium]|nr:acetylxylan esterase [Oscillospiraceae bacterium]
MPQVDMPLSELREYNGTNPRPDDFDRYWDESIAQTEAQDPQVSLTLSDYQVSFAECFDLYFSGIGGARVYAKYVRPKNIKGKVPAILVFHGYGGDSGEWSHLFGYIAAGYAVAAMDTRGQGGKSEDVGGNTGSTVDGHIIRGLNDDPKKLLYRSVFLDTAKLARIVSAFPEVDPTRVSATGGSQGGALTLACAALTPTLYKCAPAMPFLCDYKRVWEMDLCVDAYKELHTYFRHSDPRHLREDEIFTKLGYIDNQYLAPRIKSKTLMLTGLMDTICPPSTQFAAYNKITAEKEMLVYPDFGHEDMTGSYDIVFKWLTEA